MREWERSGQAGKNGNRKCLVCLKEGVGGGKSTGRQTKRDKQPTCSLLTHCASER